MRKNSTIYKAPKDLLIVVYHSMAQFYSDSTSVQPLTPTTINCKADRPRKKEICVTMTPLRMPHQRRKCHDYLCKIVLAIHRYLRNYFCVSWLYRAAPPKARAMPIASLIVITLPSLIHPYVRIIIIFTLHCCQSMIYGHSSKLDKRGISRHWLTLMQHWMSTHSFFLWSGIVIDSINVSRIPTTNRRRAYK